MLPFIYEQELLLEEIRTLSYSVDTSMRNNLPLFLISPQPQSILFVLLCPKQRMHLLKQGPIVLIPNLKQILLVKRFFVLEETTITFGVLSLYYDLQSVCCNIYGETALLYLLFNTNT